MKKTYYPRLDETVCRKVLPNGLNILVVPKPGFTRKIAYFVTNYGSVHTSFTLDGPGNRQAHSPGNRNPPE